jgi:hypothetical protein
MEIKMIPISEAEIRRISVQSHPWTNSSRDPILKISSTKKKAGGIAQDVVLCASVKCCGPVSRVLAFTGQGTGS